MDLIVWRHAEAADAAAGQDDLDRALTPKGRRQARSAAAWLDERLGRRVKVYASPARRTQQTAAAFGRKVTTLPQAAPGADAGALLAALRWQESRTPMLLVGHEPTLGNLVAHLIGLPEASFPLRKGALVWLRRRRRGGETQTVLLAALVPELM
jgi:phosphohistidine phosphatase